MPKKLLILGGSQQLGRRLIEILDLNYKYKYDIYTFNRGKTNPDLFSFTHKIIGDRNTSDIEQIFKRNWDIVLDCTCYQPHSLQKIVKGLQGKVGRYILISTISVYDYEQNKEKEELMTELFPLKKFTSQQIETEGFNFYAEKKVAAEGILLESKLTDKVILRPHFIYGKYDWQNLDYYWFQKIKKHDKILIPDSGRDLIHRTYIEDLVQIIISIFEVTNHNTIYNTTTHSPISLIYYLRILQQIINKEVHLISVKKEVLLKNKVRPVIDIPLWSNGSHFVFSNEKLDRDFNIQYTPLLQSMRETFQWNESISEWESGKSKWEEGKWGLNRERELFLMI